MRFYNRDPATETVCRYDALLAMIPKLIRWEQQEWGKPDPLDEEAEEEARRSVVEDLMSGVTG